MTAMAMISKLFNTNVFIFFTQPLCLIIVSLNRLSAKFIPNVQEDKKKPLKGQEV